jgi:hypothetical protein
MRFWFFILILFSSSFGWTQSYKYSNYVSPKDYHNYENYDYAHFGIGVSIPTGDFAGAPNGEGFHGFADIGWNLKSTLGFQIDEQYEFEIELRYINNPINQQKMMNYTRETTGENVISATTTNWYTTSLLIGPSAIYTEGNYFFRFLAKASVNGVALPKIEMIYNNSSMEGKIKQNGGQAFAFGYNLGTSIGVRPSEKIGFSLNYDYAYTNVHFDRIVLDYKNGVNTKIEFPQIISTSNFSINLIFYFKN